MLALTGRGCAATEPLLGFVCSSDRTMVAIADVVRWGCLMLGAVITMLYLRLLLDRRSRLLTGLPWRLGGAMFSAYFIAVTEWDRMHDPLTLRLPLGVAALVCLTVGAWGYRPPITADDDIDARVAVYERQQAERADRDAR